MRIHCRWSIKLLEYRVFCGADRQTVTPDIEMLYRVLDFCSTYLTLRYSGCSVSFSCRNISVTLRMNTVM